MCIVKVVADGVFFFFFFSQAQNKGGMCVAHGWTDESFIVQA